MPEATPPQPRMPLAEAAAPVMAGPATLKPEPRQLPNRSAAAEVVARPMPEPEHAGGARKSGFAGPHRRPHHFQHLSRILMLALFLLASVALVYGVLTILKNPPSKNTTRDSRELINTLRAPTVNPPLPPLPAPAPQQAPLSQPPPELPEGLEPVSPWKDSETVLEKFLTAKSLAERLPIIESKTAEDQLASSCLAASLPPARKMVPELRESNPIENLVDCYYTVEFDTGETPAPSQTILVRSRGGNAPKVVADPFLDMFGGRLAAYASGPVEHAGVFQVVVYAVASCTDPKIPNRDKKLTLKLLSCDNTKEIARAYFGRQSKIGEMLEDGTYSLSYGNAKACTVMLRWNTEDNPEHPFLEALAIKDLDWNS